MPGNPFIANMNVQVPNPAPTPTPSPAPVSLSGCKAFPTIYKLEDFDIALFNAYSQTGAFSTGWLKVVICERGLSSLQFAPAGDGNYGVDDYVAPGTPFEGTGLRLNGAYLRINNAYNLSSTISVIQNRVPDGSSGNEFVTILGLYPIGINQPGVYLLTQYYIPPDEPVVRIRMSVNAVNMSLSSAKISRIMDPDPDSYAYNSYDTDNAVGYGGISASNIAYALGGNTHKPVAIYTDGSGFTHNAKVDINWRDDPDVVLGGGLYGNATDDSTIAVAWDLGAIPQGSYKEVYVCYICGNDMSDIGA